MLPRIQSIFTPTIKQALISIFIGFVISILATIFESLLSYIRHFDPTSTGIVSGMTYYLKGSIKNLTA